MLDRRIRGWPFGSSSGQCNRSVFKVVSVTV
jgi:hypothetical protein